MLAKLFVENLLKKAGITINQADDKFKAFFENPELAKLDIPDEIVTQTDTNLISIAAAKDNYGPLKNHYTALAFNGTDTMIDQMLDELGLSDDDKNELKIEKNTNKRIQGLVKKAQAAELKKANADKPDRAAIQKTIDDLNKQIVDEKKKTADTEVSFKAKEKAMMLRYALISEISKHESIYDKTLSPEIRSMTLRNVIESTLQKKGAKVDFDESGNPILLRQDGTKYFGETHEPVDLSKFIEQSLSSEKLLVVNKPQNTPPITGNPPGPKPVISGGVPEKQVVGQNPVFQELMNGAVKDFKNINGVLQP